jgi:LAGLIDADG DNA endonuclease family
MDKSTGSSNRRTDRIPCECGCGQSILKYGSDHRLRRFVRGHQFKGNQSGCKDYDLAAILAQAEPLRPECQCGCGEKLDVPKYMQRKGIGLVGIQTHWRRHPYRQHHGIWEKRTNNFTQLLGQLTDNEYGLIYGTLLGDTSIVYPNAHSRFPRLSWTHGQSQKEWLEYKASRLAALQPKLYTTENKGYGDRSICGRTVCHPELVDVFQVVRPQRQGKQVSSDWLARVTPEGLAWWYMDDGSINFRPSGTGSIQLHTEGFSPSENQLLAQWLTDLGYPTKSLNYRSTKRNKDFFYLAMGARSTQKWIADLQQYAIPSMEYKFRDRSVDRPRNH